MPTIFQEPVTHKEQLFPDPIKVAAMRRGANWFYWIAGLSAVNSLIFALGGKVSFIIGLCYTQIVDAFSDAAVASGGPTFLRALAMVFNIAIVGFFALVGYYANRSFKTAFMIGIANPTDYKYVPDGVVNKKFLIAQYAYTPADGFKVYLNYVGGQNVDTSKVHQLDLVLLTRPAQKLGSRTKIRSRDAPRPRQ